MKGTNLLHISSKQGHLDIVKYITTEFSNPAIINVRQLNGETAVMLAGRKDHVDIVRFLHMEKGADLTLELANLTGGLSNMLYVAAHSGSHKVMSYLIDQRNDFPNPNMKFKNMSYPTAL